MCSSIMEMDWLEPWTATAGTDSQRLHQELQLELTTGNLLHDIPLEVIGRSLANDDILVKLEHPDYEFAVVHLTWQREKSPEWPRAKFYLDSNDFVENKMKIDNYDY